MTRSLLHGTTQRRMTRLCAMAAMLFWIAACGRAPQPAATDASKAEAPDAHAEAGAAHEDGDADDHESLLTIGTDTLRDLRMTTLKPEVRQDAQTASLLGELRVNEETYAEAGAPIAARASRVLAAPGDRVTRGQALVELQSPELGKARADYERARARVLVTRQAVERRRALAAERITPQRAVEEAQADADAAEADLAAARATLAAFGVTPDAAPAASSEATASGQAADSRLIVRAPVAGTIIERTVLLGQMTDPAKPLFRIANLSTLWLIVHAFERDAVQIATGARVAVNVAAMPGRTFEGRVTRIGQQVDPMSRTVEVRVVLSNQDGQLRPGMSGSAAVPVRAGTQPVTTVPAAAMQRIGNDWCVFIPRSANVFEIRRVGRGRDLGGEVEVLSGLTPQDEAIVVEGAFVLKAEWDKKRGAGDAHAH